MDKYEVGKHLMKCFPNSFINEKGEFVAHRDANEYFLLDNCETETDVKFKVLAWLSRAAYKTEPYLTKKKNEKFHEFMLKGINKFLSTNFTPEDMELIYTYFGNGCNRNMCYAFILNDYDMEIIAAMIQKKDIVQKKE